MHKSIASAAVFLAAAFATIMSLTASAGVIVVPANLMPNDQYRLVFVTSKDYWTDSLSNKVGDYNTLATNAANSLPALAALKTTWTAIVSTAASAANGAQAAIAAVDARDNTSTNPSSAKGVAIYNLAGNVVAASNAALWSGNALSNEGISIDQKGAAVTTSESVWTGTIANGTGAVGRGPPYQGQSTALGTSINYVEYGIAPSSYMANWIDAGDAYKLDTGGGTIGFAKYAIYAISGVLTVPPAAKPIPEPTSLVVWCLLGVIVSGARCWRRRKRPD